MRRGLFALSTAMLAGALVGCQGHLDVDTTKGGYGKASTETKLPPQPDPKDVIKDVMSKTSRGAPPNRAPNATQSTK